MADQENRYCFVTRVGTYKTITGSDRDDAEAKDNQSLAVGAHGVLSRWRMQCRRREHS
jgi:hypothetical protein